MCVYLQNDESQCMCACVCVCGMQEGLTSLVLATQKGHDNVVEALLNVNANPNVTEHVSIELEMVAALFIDILLLYRPLAGQPCMLLPTQQIFASLNCCSPKELTQSSEIR